MPNHRILFISASAEAAEADDAKKPSQEKHVFLFPQFSWHIFQSI